MSELSPQARAFLDETRLDDEPSARDRSRIRAALPAHLAAGTGSIASTLAPTANPSRWSVLGGAAKLGFSLSAVALALAGAGAVSYVDHRAAKTAARAGEVGSEAVGAWFTTIEEGREVTIAGVNLLADPAADFGALESDAKTKNSGIDGEVARGPREARIGGDVSGTLGTQIEVDPAPGVDPRELVLLQEAHLALESGQASRALALLDEHATQFRFGALAEERTAARVFTLCRLGRTSDARRDAAQFLSTYPASPERARVETSCAAEF